MAGEPAADAATDARCREAAVAPEAAPSAQPLRLLPLYTPAEAARLLAVPESWLRRQVTARLVPHTRLGKHLRFSHADLVVIAAAAARPAGVRGPGPAAVRGSPTPHHHRRVVNRMRAGSSASGANERPYPVPASARTGGRAAAVVGRDGGAVGMAWVEQCGNRSWRVRYRRDDGTIGAVHGFATKTAATEHANTLEADQREGRFLDPAAGKITLSEWSAGLAASPGCGDPHRGRLPQPAAPPHPAPLGRARPGRHLRDQGRRLGQRAARPRLLGDHGDGGDEAAVAAAGRRRPRNASSRPTRSAPAAAAAAAPNAAPNACGPPRRRCWRSPTTPPASPTPDPRRRS